MECEGSAKTNTIRLGLSFRISCLHSFGKGVGVVGGWGGGGCGANCKHWFTTSFLQGGGRCRKAVLGVWVQPNGV